MVEGGGFKRSDIVTFTRCFGRQAAADQGRPVGGPKPLPAEDEPTLDVSMLTRRRPEADRIYVYEGGDCDGNDLETAGGGARLAAATAPT